MPRWLPKVIVRIRELAEHGAVILTLKAQRELAQLGLGLDEEDARDVLRTLDVDDFFERRASDATGEWMYVFKPAITAQRLYVKVIVRKSCVVISFHEDEEHDDEEAR